MLHGYKYHTSTTVSPPHISTAYLFRPRPSCRHPGCRARATHVLWTYSWLKTDSWHFLPSVHTLHISHIISFGHPACFVLSFSSHSDILHNEIHLLIVAFSLTLCTSINPTVSTHFPTRFLPHFHRASASSVSPWAFCLGPRGNRCPPASPRRISHSKSSHAFSGETRGMSSSSSICTTPGNSKRKLWQNS